MLRYMLVGAFCLLMVSSAQAVVYINEILLNPPGSGGDDTQEFIELQGAPGMRLDGYAIALLNGSEEKLFAVGSLGQAPHEIDELFSLDGLSLGRTGCW